MRREVRIGAIELSIKRKEKKRKKIRKCLGRDEKPYPGLVLNVDTDDVFGSMHAHVGQNRFYWP